MHRGIIRVAAVSFAALVVTTLGGTTAGAATDTGWVPVGPSEPDTTQVCGTTLTITEKVNKVESRTREDGKGNVRTDYRGTYIVKVSAPDGRKVVLNNSGPYSVFVSAAGETRAFIQPPSLIYAFDDGERAAFKRAGLPPAFYYTKGTLKIFVSSAGVTRVLAKPSDPVSVCKLLR